MEQWKWIKGYENYYQISNYGKIKSYMIRRSRVINKKKTPIDEPRKEPMILKGNKGKYISVKLCKNGLKECKMIHRIVAEHFIPNENKEKNLVHHKDENKHNNHINNLQWVSQIENNALSYYQYKEKIPQFEPLFNEVLKNLDN